MRIRKKGLNGFKSEKKNGKIFSLLFLSENSTKNLHSRRERKKFLVSLHSICITFLLCQEFPGVFTVMIVTVTVTVIVLTAMTETVNSDDRTAIVTKNSKYCDHLTDDELSEM